MATRQNSASPGPTVSVLVNGFLAVIVMNVPIIEMVSSILCTPFIPLNSHIHCNVQHAKLTAVTKAAFWSTPADTFKTKFILESWAFFHLSRMHILIFEVKSSYQYQNAIHKSNAAPRVEKVHLQECFMLMTQDSIGHRSENTLHECFIAEW